MEELAFAVTNFAGIDKAPAGAAVISQGRQPLDFWKQNESPGGATHRRARGFALPGLRLIFAVVPRGSRPWLMTFAPTGAKTLTTQSFAPRTNLNLVL